MPYQLNFRTTFRSYKTSYAITISNIEEAIEIVNIDEGLYLGYAMALRKGVKTIPNLKKMGGLPD